MISSIQVKSSVSHRRAAAMDSSARSASDAHWIRSCSQKAGSAWSVWSAASGRFLRAYPIQVPRMRNTTASSRK